MNTDKTKSKYKVLGHFAMQPIGFVMLSNTKHIHEAYLGETLRCVQGDIITAPISYGRM